MLNDIRVFSIREYLSDIDNQGLGENDLKQIFSEFSCDENLDVECLETSLG